MHVQQALLGASQHGRSYHTVLGRLAILTANYCAAQNTAPITPPPAYARDILTVWQSVLHASTFNVRVQHVAATLGHDKTSSVPHYHQHGSIDSVLL